MVEIPETFQSSFRIISGTSTASFPLTWQSTSDWHGCPAPETADGAQTWPTPLSANGKSSQTLQKMGPASYGSIQSGGHWRRNSGPFSKENDGPRTSGALAETRANSPDLEHALNDPELVAIVAAWRSFPTSARADNNALTRNSGDRRE